MGFRLRISKGKSEGKEFSFAKDRITVGRNHDNDLVIYDLNISRQHFEIVAEGHRYRVRDLGSRNGMKLNDDPAIDELLKEGDRILAGGVEFEFLLSDTQPGIRMAPDQRGEVDEPGSETQRLILEQIQTHAINLQALQDAGDQPLRTVPAGSPVRSMHKPKKKTASPQKAASTQRLPERVPARRGTPVYVYPLIALVVCVVVVSAFWGVHKAPPPDRSHDQFPLQSSAIAQSYGAGKVDVPTKDGAQFSFTWHGERALLYFTPGSIDENGEVKIMLNGTFYADVPATGPKWGKATELKLQRALLINNAPNTVVFVPSPASDGRWGIREVYLSLEQVPAPSLAAARDQMRLGQDALEHKRVDPPNLYRAEESFHRAILLLDALVPTPPEVAQAEAGYRAAHEELQTTIEGHIFDAERAERFGHIDEAQAALRQVLLYLPSDADLRRQDIQGRLARLKK